MSRQTDPTVIMQQYAEYLMDQEDIVSLDTYAREDARLMNADLREYVKENDLNRDGVLDKRDATKDNPNPAHMHISPAGVEKGIQPVLRALTEPFDSDGNGSFNRIEERHLNRFLQQHPLPDTFMAVRPELRNRIQEGGVLTTKDVVDAYKEALAPYIEAAQEFVAQEVSPSPTPAGTPPAKEEKAR